MSFSRNTYPIGVDLADQYVYAAQFKKNANGPVIRGLYDRMLDKGLFEWTADDPDLDAEFSGQLTAIFKEIRTSDDFADRRIVLKLPAHLLFTFPVTFELEEEATVEAAIVRECRRYLSFPLEEAVIDYPGIDRMADGDTPRYRASIIAVRRDQVEKYLSLASSAGLVVEAIDYGMAALFRLHHHLYPIKPKPMILCNLGYRQSLLAIVTADNILAQRAVTWGFHDIAERIRSNFELPAASGSLAGLIRTCGLRYETGRHGQDAPGDNSSDTSMGDMDVHRTVYQVLAPYVDELIHELHQIIAYVRSETRHTAFESIALYGQGSDVHHLDQYLESRLGIPTRCINPMTKISAGEKSVDSSGAANYAIALGLGLRQVKWL
ncbi:MAG: pilus assembly protein PilM [Desulfobacteraceae bacterium]|nr:pilus assembly protein PilM [Desulfobacteraceae bacterium]